MSKDIKEINDYVLEVVEKSRLAQAILEIYSQEDVDELTAAIAYYGTREDFAKNIGEFAVKEGEFGRAEDKKAKMFTKIKGAYRDMKGEKSVGVIDIDNKKGIMKIAKPMGVIAGIVPSTNPEATPFVKSLFAIKSRNSIILAPHPKTRQTNMMAVNKIREILKEYGAPEDLVISIDPEYVSLEAIDALMQNVDFILATGSSDLVKAAYSSGTPAIGVGVGNSTTIVDGTTDLKNVANMIKRSKTFDYATSCSSENNCIINKKVYDEFIEAMENEGGYLIKDNSKEKEMLQKALWPNFPKNNGLNKDIIARPLNVIAEAAGINIPKEKEFIMVEESGVGKGYPFSGEKLSVVTTIHKYDDFSEAVDKVSEILKYQGSGHSCGIHTSLDYHVLEMAEKVKASRMLVNQAQSLGNSGSWTNGMPMSMTVGCSTWGGNSVSHNVNWKDLLNYTYVSFPIPSTEPTDEELFGAKFLNKNA